MTTEERAEAQAMADDLRKLVNHVEQMSKIVENEDAVEIAEELQKAIVPVLKAALGSLLVELG